MLDGPFRGSDAVARGLLTRAELRSGRFRSPFRGIYLRAEIEATLAMRSQAGFLLLRDGALAGYSAAELLGAPCAPHAVPAEVITPRRGAIRARPGLVVRHGALPVGDVCRAGGCRVTTPMRTAWDLARRLDRTEAVVAVDALARLGRFPAELLLAGRTHRPRSPGCRRLDHIVALADPRAESPMESRLRMFLVTNGLPVPEPQFPLRNAYGRLSRGWTWPTRTSGSAWSTTARSSTVNAAARTTTAT